MESLNITQDWQKLADITTIRENKRYTIQNNDCNDIIFFIGDTAPEEKEEDYGIIYSNGGQLINIELTDFNKLFLKLSSISEILETKKTIIF